MLMLGEQHCHFKDKWVGWHGVTSLALEVSTGNFYQTRTDVSTLYHRASDKLLGYVWVDMLQSRGHHYFDRAVTNMDYCPFDLLVHKNQAIE